jgi:hypothetical protein
MKGICQNPAHSISTLRVLQSTRSEQQDVCIEYRLYQAELSAPSYIMEVILDKQRKCVVLDMDRPHAEQICQFFAKAAVTPCTVCDVLREIGEEK